MKKLKSELKNEEMALVLLKKLKQSQTISRETIISGGATLTPANKNSKGDLKGQYSNKNNFDLLASADKLVSDFLFGQHCHALLYPQWTLVECQSNGLSIFSLSTPSRTHSITPRYLLLPEWTHVSSVRWPTFPLPVGPCQVVRRHVTPSLRLR